MGKAKAMMETKGDLWTAEQTLKEALELQPNNSAAETLLNKLQEQMGADFSPWATFIWLIASSVIVCIALLVQDRYFGGNPLISKGWMMGVNSSGGDSVDWMRQDDVGVEKLSG